MNSKHDFFDTIYNYYLNRSDGKIPVELIREVSKKIAAYYYDQYRRFNDQYPRSTKRYATFQLKDLSHPTTFEMVVAYFKRDKSHRHFSEVLLNMSEEELIEFEKSREDFNNMW